MSKPKRIQRKRTKGWRLPPNTVCVSRPSQWGNPYRVGPQYNYVGDLVAVWDIHRVLDAYREHVHVLLYFRPEIIEEIRGKNLACWCPLDRPCHADVLLELANQ